jgi:hypothetical protein
MESGCAAGIVGEEFYEPHQDRLRIFLAFARNWQANIAAVSRRISELVSYLTIYHLRQCVRSERFRSGWTQEMQHFPVNRPLQSSIRASFISNLSQEGFEGA